MANTAMNNGPAPSPALSSVRDTGLRASASSLTLRSPPNGLVIESDYSGPQVDE